MARIAGVDLPREKRIEVSLQYIHGIGKTTASLILERARVAAHVPGPILALAAVAEPAVAGDPAFGVEAFISDDDLSGQNTFLPLTARLVNLSTAALWYVRAQPNSDGIATINLGEGTKWTYELKTLPRPSGRATRVIYTEYDLPRERIQPHDVIVDAEGIAWYSSFGEQNLGRLDPRTGRVREFPIPEAKPGFPTGLLGLRSDKAGNLWLGNMYQAQIEIGRAHV